MPTFTYVAINDQGQEIKGSLDAADQNAAERALENQELMPLKLTAGADSKAKSPVRGMGAGKQKRRRITDRDLIDFSRQFVTLHRAGVPILSSLETLAGQADNPAFTEVLMQVASDIASGNDFSAALKKHPKVFGDLYVNSVKAGEVGGVLDEVIHRLTGVMQRDAEIARALKAQCATPSSW